MGGHGGMGMSVEKAKDFKGTMKTLWSYLSNYKFAIILVAVFAIGSTIFSIVGPKILGNATTELFNGLMDKLQGGSGINFGKIGEILLFLIGLYVVSASFSFIQGFAPKSITAAPDIEAYLSFVLTMFLAFGLAFEVPIAVVVLARMGVVSVEKLKSFRGYFIVVAFVIAAIVTPPDVVSQLALAIPMCLLYEVGIWAAQVFIRHTQAPEESQESTS